MNVIIAGVGGQGILFTSRVIGEAALRKGIRYIQSEVHGLSQRYGSIHTEIRLGEKVMSPLIMEGTLDLMMALEPLEALRRVRYMCKKTVVVMNDHVIPPVISYLEKMEVPDLQEIIYLLRKVGVKKIYLVSATKLAMKAGDPVVANSVLLGAAAKVGVLPFTKEELMSSLSDLSPERFREINLRAFDLGYENVSEI